MRRDGRGAHRVFRVSVFLGLVFLGAVFLTVDILGILVQRLVGAQRMGFIEASIHLVGGEAEVVRGGREKREKCEMEMEM